MSSKVPVPQSSLRPVGLEKRTSAAEAVVGRPFMARLNPCPSCRDAFSLSMFGACAPDEPEKSPGAKARVVVELLRPD
jgi:hypothetical protein